MSDRKPSQRSGVKAEDGAESSDSARSRSWSPNRSRLRQEAAEGSATGPGKGSILTRQKNKYLSSSDADAEDFVDGLASNRARTRRQKALKAKKKAEQQSAFVSNQNHDQSNLGSDPLVSPQGPPKVDPNPPSHAGGVEQDGNEADKNHDGLSEATKNSPA